MKVLSDMEYHNFFVRPYTFAQQRAFPIHNHYPDGRDKHRLLLKKDLDRGAVNAVGKYMPKRQRRGTQYQAL